MCMKKTRNQKIAIKTETVILGVWWSVQEFHYWKFLSNGSTITLIVYFKKYSLHNKDILPTGKEICIPICIFIKYVLTINRNLKYKTIKYTRL